MDHFQVLMKLAELENRVSDLEKTVAGHSHDGVKDKKKMKKKDKKKKIGVFFSNMLNRYSFKDAFFVTIRSILQKHYSDKLQFIDSGKEDVSKFKAVIVFLPFDDPEDKLEIFEQYEPLKDWKNQTKLFYVAMVSSINGIDRSERINTTGKILATWPINYKKDWLTQTREVQMPTEQDEKGFRFGFADLKRRLKSMV